VTFESEYVNLLIKQYWEKTKASAEIEMKASSWRRSFDWLSSFENEFDLDSATGDRLDIIGRIVGIGRAIPYAVPKIAFGFDENPNSRGFDDLFSPLNDRVPFQDLFESESTELVLDDNSYRLFIRAKIKKNISSPYLVSDDSLSIQDATINIFGGLAYVTDNYDMTMTMHVSPVFSSSTLDALFKMSLIPKPQGVRYIVVIE
jgi:hypothetical protein